MSYTLDVTHLSDEQITFGFSAAHETLIALHVFIDCKHHPLHIPWVIEARKKINPALKAEIEAFSIFYKRPIVPFWELHEESAMYSFDRELSQWVENPVEVYVQTAVETILNKQVSDPDALQEFKNTADKGYHASKEVVEELLENPYLSRQRFVNMLEAFWNACVKEEWLKIEELFLKDIEFRGRKLQQEGPLSLLASLAKEIDIYPEKNRAVIRRISKREIHFDEKDPLFLAPTYFAWPHLFVTHCKPVGINYSIMEHQLKAAQPMPPEELLKFFKAMGDFTRLQIVKYLSQQPRSTSELAALIGITDGAVSKHLKQLGDAGIIGSKRESYYVLYHLLEQPFIDLPEGLSQFLR